MISCLSSFLLERLIICMLFVGFATGSCMLVVHGTKNYSYLDFDYSLNIGLVLVGFVEIECSFGFVEIECIYIYI